MSGTEAIASVCVLILALEILGGVRHVLRAPHPVTGRRCDGDHGEPLCSDPQCWRNGCDDA